MTDVNHAENLLSADQAVQKIRTNILSNAQPHPWLDEYIQRNQVTVASLIDNDTFGLLSNFDEVNPAPASIDQVNILQAFLLKKANFRHHDVNSITETLSDYLKKIQDQNRAFDNLFFVAQLRGQEGWATALPVGVDAQLNALNLIQILNHMDHLLQSVEQPSQDKKNLSDWISKQRTEIANNPGSYKIADNKIELPYFLSGAGQISQFVRKEIQNILDLYRNTRNDIINISNKTPLSFFEPRFMLKLLLSGVNFAIQMGSTALLPYRLALTIFREVRYQLEKAVEYVGKKCLPVRLQWLAWIPAVIVGSIAIQYYESYFSFQMIMGLQFFPQSWSWGFIGKMTLGFSLAELGLGAGLGIAKYIKKLCFGNAVVPQLAANLPEANQAQQGTALNKDQKDRLRVLLMRDNMSIDANADLPADKKAKKKEKRGNEMVALGYETQPYFLSKLDKKLLNKLETLPEAFNNLEAEIKAVARP